MRVVTFLPCIFLPLSKSVKKSYTRYARIYHDLPRFDRHYLARLATSRNISSLLTTFWIVTFLVPKKVTIPIHDNKKTSLKLMSKKLHSIRSTQQKKLHSIRLKKLRSIRSKKLHSIRWAPRLFENYYQLVTPWGNTTFARRVFCRLLTGLGATLLRELLSKRSLYLWGDDRAESDVVRCTKWGQKKAPTEVGA